MSSEITIRPRKVKISRPRRIEHQANNNGQLLHDLHQKVASADEMRELKDSLDRFREAFSGERRAAVEVKTQLGSLYGPSGKVDKLEKQIEELRTIVLRTVGWATGAAAVTVSLVGWYERSHH